MKEQLDLKEIGKRLKKLRKDASLRQIDLSEEFGCKRESISAYENGRQLLSTSILWMYMQFFGVSADYILTGKELQNLENIIREIKFVCNKYECKK